MNIAQTKWLIAVTSQQQDGACKPRKGVRKLLKSAEAEDMEKNGRVS